VSDWQECKLGDAPFEVIDGDRGTNYPKQDQFSSTGYCLFLNAKNVTTDGFEFSDCYFVSKEKDETLRKGKLQRNDIILTTRGTVGNIAFYNSRVPYEHIRINSGMIIIRPNVNGILPEYTYQLFKFLKRDFDVFATGSAQPQLPIRDLKEIDILLPPLPEQRAIAAVLSSLDDKIDLLNRQNKTLEGLAETLWRKMFIQDADPNWEVINFEDFFDFLEGPGIRNWQYTLTGTRFINIRLINNGEIDTSKASFVSNEEANTKYEHFLLKEDDMIVSTSGTLGKTAIVRDYHLPLMLNTSVIRFRPKDGISHAFLYQYLNSAQFQNHLEAVATGSVQSNFGPVHLKQMKLNRPPENILQNYLNKADNFYKKIKLNSLQIRTLSILRDGLLPKLMSGEVRVKV